MTTFPDPPEYDPEDKPVSEEEGDAWTDADMQALTDWLYETMMGEENGEDVRGNDPGGTAGPQAQEDGGTPR